MPLFLLALISFSACNSSPAGSNPGPTPQDTPLVVILGSSTAAGVGANQLDSAWAYRIQGVVNQNGVKAKFIDLAVAGYTTYQAMPTGNSVANRPAPDTKANVTKALSLNPTLVLISFPGNDIANNYTSTEIMHNYSVITQTLEAAGVKYIVFGDQPRDFPSYAQRLREKTMDDSIKAAFTFHVNDFFMPLSTSTYMINPIYSAGDGIHLNDKGQALIMNATLNQPIFDGVISGK